MKKTISFVTILAICFCAHCAVLAHPVLVYDETGLLSAEELAGLSAIADSLLETYNIEVALAIVEDDAGGGLQKLASEMAQFLALGESSDGFAMLYMNMATMDYSFVVEDGAKAAFTDYGIQLMLNSDLLPLLGRDDFAGAFSSYYDVASYYLEQASIGRPVDSNGNTRQEQAPQSNTGRIVAIVFIPLLVAWIACSGWKAQMKTANVAKKADNYISLSSFKLQVDEDEFIERTTTVVNKEAGKQQTANRSGKF